MNTIQQYKTRKYLQEALRLPFNEGHRWVDLCQIVRLEGIGNYTTFFFADGSTLLVALTLKRLHNRLPLGSFVRLHRKHLVNRTHVASIQPVLLTVRLTNGDSLKIARRRAEEIRQTMCPGTA